MAPAGKNCWDEIASIHSFELKRDKIRFLWQISSSDFSRKLCGIPVGLTTIEVENIFLDVEILTLQVLWVKQWKTYIFRNAVFVNFNGAEISFDVHMFSWTHRLPSAQIWAERRNRSRKKRTRFWYACQLTENIRSIKFLFSTLSWL